MQFHGTLHQKKRHALHTHVILQNHDVVVTKVIQVQAKEGFSLDL